MQRRRTPLLLPLMVLVAGCGSAPGTPTSPAAAARPGAPVDTPGTLSYSVEDATGVYPDEAAEIESEAATSAGDARLAAEVAATCEPTGRYGVRASTGIDDLWYRVDAQWIELVDGVRFTSYVTVNRGDGTEVALGEIPPVLLGDPAISSAVLCFDGANGLPAGDHDDPGRYEPYDVVPQGGTPRPSRPGG